MADDAHNERYANAIRAARAEGGDRFQSWFNRADSEDEAFRRGEWDFAFHVLTPPVVARLDDPGSKTALEIGCGGGRLLAAASRFFGHAVGIDVHAELDAVRETLARRGCHNVTLLPTDGASIPAEDATIDLVYSFIVLQHLPTVGALQRYVVESHRVLKPGGVAQLYYGRLHSRDPRRRYREIDAAVNHVSLDVSPRHMRRLCLAAGFEVVGSARSYKRVPDGYPQSPGGQSAITLRRNPG